MKPILWVDPMIISLNESMLDYIGSPSPILLGFQNIIINYQKKNIYFRNKRFQKNFLKLFRTKN